MTDAGRAGPFIRASIYSHVPRRIPMDIWRSSGYGERIN